MSENLFQDENGSRIDRPVLEKTSEVKNFDFNRPNKFSKEQLMSMEMIHSNFARIVSNYLSAYLRASIKIRVTSVQQLTYEDFVNSIPSPTLITVFTLEPLKRSAIFESSMQYVFPVLDLMFGGKGNVMSKYRALTEIEVSVMKRLHAKILELYGKAWSDIFEIKINVESMETNPRFSQSITPKETVAVISFNAYIDKTEGVINICIPFTALDPVISGLSAHFWLAEGLSGPDEKEVVFLEKTISRVKSDITVEVGEVEISVRDFLQLQKGDVLQLNRSVNEDMDLFVDNLLKFKVKPGISGNKLAVQIAAGAEGE